MAEEYNIIDQVVIAYCRIIVNEQCCLHWGIESLIDMCFQTHIMHIKNIFLK
jgi:hypothetical protein